jgi:hypothetical protein
MLKFKVILLYLRSVAMRRLKTFQFLSSSLMLCYARYGMFIITLPKYQCIGLSPCGIFPDQWIIISIVYLSHVYPSSMTMRRLKTHWFLSSSLMFCYSGYGVFSIIPPHYQYVGLKPFGFCPIHWCFVMLDNGFYHYTASVPMRRFKSLWVLFWSLNNYYSSVINTFPPCLNNNG